MMAYSQIILMAVLVSLDALFVGFSIGNQQKFKLSKYAISIAAITFFVFLGYALALLVKQYFEIDLKYFSIVIFFIFGIKNLFTKDNNEEKNLSIKGLLLLNFTLSLDGTILAFSTAFNDERIIIPITICVVHYLLLFIGWLFASSVSRRFKYSNIISGIALILLAILKLCGII